MNEGKSSTHVVLIGQSLSKHPNVPPGGEKCSFGAGWAGLLPQSGNVKAGG